MLSPPVNAESLSYLAVNHKLLEWTHSVGQFGRIAELNERLLASTPSTDNLLSQFDAPEMQCNAAFTHDTEIGRLAYAAWPADSATAISNCDDLRALLLRTRRSLLWRLANQGLFALLAETLFCMIAEAWPQGELSLSNVKGEDGLGGHFTIWLPADADEGTAAAGCKGSEARGVPLQAVGEPAEPVLGGLLIAQCTFRVVVQEQSGAELELARFACAVIVDLDKRRHVNQVVNCSVPPELLAPLGSPRLLSASMELGHRQQHLAQPLKVGWMVKRAHWLPVWRRRWVVLHHGCIRYWTGLPPFHPQEWSEEELSQHTSNDVIQLAGASLVLPADRDRELHLFTPRSRFPCYWFRVKSAEELDEWKSAIAQHIWPDGTAAPFFGSTTRDKSDREFGVGSRRQ